MAKFKCINLKCERHCQSVDYIRHKSIIKGGETTYLDKYNKEIICPNCGKVLEFIQPETNGFPQVRTQTFNSLSNEDKKKVLLKREKHYDKKNKQQQEYKQAIDRGEISQ